MFNKLITSHIKKVESFNYDNIILVYKGLPIKFLIELSNTFPFLNDKNTIIKQNKINLRNIWENRRELIIKILNKNKDIHILTYEEFNLVFKNLPDLHLFKGQIIVFENNLFDDYPNQSTEIFVDIEQCIENDNLNFKENNLFSEFYSDSSFYKDVNLIKYKNINFDEFKNVEITPFFEKEIINFTLQYDEIEPDAILSDDVIIFPSSDSYLDLELQIFREDKITKLELVVNNTAILFNKEYEKELKRLKILSYIFKENKVELKISVKKKIFKKDYRHEFENILYKYWKSNDFRELSFYKHPEIDKEKDIIRQGSIIEEIVRQSEKAYKEGENSFNDIFLTAPTGSGKSILFQIPAIYLANTYKMVTIVVSPLKSLMVDQVESLKNRGVSCATFINSDISLLERENIIEKIKNGTISILYLSPELLLSYNLKHFIGDRKVGLLVIDEAHLVTTWGRDFRVDYWYLGNYIRKLRKYSEYAFPVFALTATAVFMGENDIVFQTVESLHMQTPTLFIGNVVRKNINFEIGKFEYKGSHEIRKIERTKYIIQKNIDNSIKTIVYFPWITQIKSVINELDIEYKEKVGEYYGDLDKTIKQIVLEKFQSGEILIILATKAFGMGVDIKDIRVIYHHAPSGNLLDYIQEIGRAAREENIMGIAKTDFCEKDLKFTRILHGLSSIKQYQIKFALKKVWDIYSHKKNQNFLASIDDFGFIFSDQIKNLETKVKSTLMLLEKDLIKKYNYNVIIARPKSLFSEVFACVPEKIEKQFLNKYGMFCHKVSTIKENYRTGFGKKPTTTQDIGNIYKIELNKIWENYFVEESFPIVKRNFFERKLFCDFAEDIVPRYRLTINLNQSKNETMTKIEEYFTKIDNVFKKIQGKFFTKGRLLNLLKENFEDEILRRRIVDLILNLYTSPSEWGETGRGLKYDTFLQSKRDESGDLSFRVVNFAYIKIKSFVLGKLSSMFKDENILKYCKYIATDDRESEFRIKISYLLESFNLGNYTIVGGQLPQIFIRVNDPYILKQLTLDRKYTNQILQEIENRYRSSVEIMNYFFTEDMESNSRWDYVENYFLGKK